MTLDKNEQFFGKGFCLPWWKRPFDLVVSSAAIILFFPVMLLVAAAIKLGDGGSVVFVQERPGLKCKPFKLYKFRTMYVNGDDILLDYISKNPEAKKEWETYRKLRRSDPRITPVGRILRRFSLDELPQLFNVLKGDMSVVGPRPYLYEEIEEYGVPDEIFTVKPGLTGLWQVSGRNELSFSERIRLDLEYVRKLSFWFDMKILIKTVWVVITGKGAY